MCLPTMNETIDWNMYCPQRNQLKVIIDKTSLSLFFCRKGIIKLWNDGKSHIYLLKCVTALLGSVHSVALYTRCCAC